MLRKLFLILFLCASLIACRKNSQVSSYPATPPPPPNNYDKGIGFQEDFDHVVSDWTYYNTDTVSTSIVNFIALDSPLVSCFWSIGAKIYTTKKVSLAFPADYVTKNSQVPVTLTIKYTTDQGRDTTRSFTKTLIFFNPCNSRFNGVFKGTIDRPDHAGGFSISACAHDPLYIDNGLYMQNLETGCGRYFSQGADSYELGFRQIAFSGAGTSLCLGPAGTIRLVGDSLFMSYKSFDSGYNKSALSHSFKGIKQ